MGVHAELVRTVDTTTAAIDAALDLSVPAPQPLEFPVPTDYDAGRNVQAIAQPIAWWLGRMARRERLVEERLVWFWHDHFATSIAKVRIPYLMWQQHLTLRQHATGNYAELLHSIARDPAMILYLDGITSAAQERNENFGRRCLELFTIGRDGGYTQHDVIEASRSFTGWIVNLPGRPFARALSADPWTAVFLPQRHDAGTKTLLGKTGTFDMDGALDVILDDPSTARFVTTKLYRELVGLNPSRRTVDRLASKFRRLRSCRLSKRSRGRRVRLRCSGARYRTPVEKLVGIVRRRAERCSSACRDRAGTTCQRRRR